MFESLQFLVILLAIPAVGIYLKRRINRRLPYPPGPKKWPIVGNLLDIPRSWEWKTYAEWSKQYKSDIIHLQAAGNDLIILNNLKMAKELFEKRSAIYSNRPQFAVINELMGWKWLMSAMSYGDPWKERRRHFQQYFHPGNAALYQPSQLEAVRKMLRSILNEPEDLMAITRHTIGGLAISLAYGLNIREKDDPYIAVAEKAGRSITQAAVPGAFLVDFVPVLRYVPEWFPGAGWKKTMREWKKVQGDFRELPFEAALADMASGNARPSLVSVSMGELDPSTDSLHQRNVIKDTAGIVFAAGSDTTLASVYGLFAALLCFPDVQKRAQAELDSVLHGRLPEFEDTENLPYISALVKEVLRWQPATPISVPHSTSQDDVYMGYHIPKDAIVIGNVWAMLQNEDVYPDPTVFRPERFLKDGKLDASVQYPEEMAFGFGRRVCPGAHIAMSVLWLTAASFLSVFNISAGVDETGVSVEPKVEWKSGLIVHPHPFKYTITPRSKTAEEIIKAGADDYQ